LGKKYNEINDKIKTFIQDQKLFFVGTAASDGRVSVSPKGIDTFRIINKNRIVWLNLSGSGNETATHLLESTRMTIMFCAFEGSPSILRLYGKASAIHPRDPEWKDLMSLLPSNLALQEFKIPKVFLLFTQHDLNPPKEWDSF